MGNGRKHKLPDRNTWHVPEISGTFFCASQGYDNCQQLAGNFALQIRHGCLARALLCENRANLYEKRYPTIAPIETAVKQDILKDPSVRYYYRLLKHIWSLYGSFFFAKFVGHFVIDMYLPPLNPRASDWDLFTKKDCIDSRHRFLLTYRFLKKFRQKAFNSLALIKKYEEACMSGDSVGISETEPEISGMLMRETGLPRGSLLLENTAKRQIDFVFDPTNQFCRNVGEFKQVDRLERNNAAWDDLRQRHMLALKDLHPTASERLNNLNFLITHRFVLAGVVVEPR